MVNRRMSIALFKPDVAATEEGGECKRLNIPGFGRQVGLAFPTAAAPVREVWVTYADGEFVKYYSDTRGDLVERVVGQDGGPPRPGEAARKLPPAGRQTSIHINFENQLGLAMNVGGDKPALRVQGTVQQMLTAENLGNPENLIKLVTKRCGM
jgi:hypothetical protein